MNEQSTQCGQRKSAERVAMEIAIEALEKIALAGMSGTGQESDEGIKAWHARQAWKFIGIAARALEPIKEALAQPSDSVETPIDFELAYGEIYKNQRAALAKSLAQPAVAEQHKQRSVSEHLEPVALPEQRPIESDYVSQVAYTRALEAYCDELVQPIIKSYLEKDNLEEDLYDLAVKADNWGQP